MERMLVFNILKLKALHLPEYWKPVKKIPTIKTSNNRRKGDFPFIILRLRAQINSQTLIFPQSCNILHNSII
jgi:hypothetical protein